MATREENLKKINDELEKMSDEELELVAGGTPTGMSADTCVMAALGYDIKPTSAHLIRTNGSILAETVQKMTAIFQSVGVGFAGSNDSRIANVYIFNGQRIPRYAALELLAVEKGKDLPKDLNTYIP